MHGLDTVNFDARLEPRAHEDVCFELPETTPSLESPVYCEHDLTRGGARVVLECGDLIAVVVTLTGVEYEWLDDVRGDRVTGSYIEITGYTRVVFESYLDGDAYALTLTKDEMAALEYEARAAVDEIVAEKLEANLRDAHEEE